MSNEYLSIFLASIEIPIEFQNREQHVSQQKGQEISARSCRNKTSFKKDRRAQNSLHLKKEIIWKVIGKDVNSIFLNERAGQENTVLDNYEVESGSCELSHFDQPNKHYVSL